MKSEMNIIKEEHHWRSDEKIKHCGYGEWVEEPDVFHFEHLGYEACICRCFVKEPFAKEEAYFGGHLCGYVKIPEDHPYFRKKDIILDCHGGITLNESHEEHWVGFDCGHSGDKVPTMEHLRNTRPELIALKKDFPIPPGMEDHYLFNPRYRNLDYCIEECKNMIFELKQVTSQLDSLK